VHHGHFILLNVAIGGSCTLTPMYELRETCTDFVHPSLVPDVIKGGKTPGPATVPGKSMIVDWVAVYNSPWG
jgi:hypothetical protein